MSSAPPSDASSSSGGLSTRSHSGPGLTRLPPPPLRGAPASAPRRPSGLGSLGCLLHPCARRVPHRGGCIMQNGVPPPLRGAGSGRGWAWSASSPRGRAGPSQPGSAPAGMGRRKNAVGTGTGHPFPAQGAAVCADGGRCRAFGGARRRVVVVLLRGLPAYDGRRPGEKGLASTESGTESAGTAPKPSHKPRAQSTRRCTKSERYATAEDTSEARGRRPPHRWDQSTQATREFTVGRDAMSPMRCASQTTSGQ